MIIYIVYFYILIILNSNKQNYSDNHIISLSYNYLKLIIFYDINYNTDILIHYMPYYNIYYILSHTYNII